MALSTNVGYILSADGVEFSVLVDIRSSCSSVVERRMFKPPIISMKSAIHFFLVLSIFYLNLNFVW